MELATVLDLLKCLLVSKTPLSDVFLSKRETTYMVKVEQRDISPSQVGRVVGSGDKKISVKLMLSKSNDKVVYAEAGDDFIDLLFSFLTLLVGSVVQLLGKCSSIGCVDNLCKSVEDLSADGLINCNVAKLINPKLASHIGCKSQLLQIEERSQFYAMNPKSSGGGYTKGPVKFMVTDDLDVKPFSTTTIISLLKKFSLPLSDIEEQVVSVGEEEALDLLKTSLISKMVLNNAFPPRKRKWVGMVSDEDKVLCTKRKMETNGSRTEIFGKIKMYRH
ncbi:uncharacterized protein LOC143858451 [Tasmannia lanceolata]|uniref:uncharacterized protein LOC143858451 n=1 Tax=Tasmannia lanceolata TaxID=3420 RepID=UPI0040645F00